MESYSLEWNVSILHPLTFVMMDNKNTYCF